MILPDRVFAASCCGGGSIAPAVVLGDYRTQVQASVSHGVVIGDAPDQGRAVFRRSGDRNSTNTYQLTGATLLSDRIQVNAGIPVVSQTAHGQSSSGATTRLGDVRFGFNYEALPEWAYTHWVPNIFVMLQMTFPTGQSIYETGTQATSDITGGGFYKPSLGALLVKQKNFWDLSFVPQLNYSFTRTFSGLDGDSIKVSPGWGGSVAFGVGYSPGGESVRFGIVLQPTINQARIVTTSTGTTRSSEQTFTDTSLNMSYLFANHTSLIASYTDQTLLGPAKNTTLSRIFSLSIQLKQLR